MRNFTEGGTKVVAAALNYPSQAAEGRKAPAIFLKPTSSYIKEGEKIRIPPGYNRVHYEVELGCVIGRRGKNIPKEEALNYVSGYALGLDMTLFDRIDMTKHAPWDIAKGFDTSCPVSRFIEKDELKNPDDTKLWLKVNQEMVHECNTKDMLFKIPDLISYASQFMTLEEGDLLLTGASGNGPVYSGDRITCGLNEIVQMEFDVSN
ncbi:uncharacterized protein TRIADDRAFT_32597 [Trichoplax adhaerens]|uniref:oxaloacetate tautomerase n=1 Tax=Trichoplax adhaerens TaxID=10228 RepID=B3SB69_TRIAD|nr:hypothetical protein TRIADDRAFT_32597 [Trichoplax adhaerens]EDV20055.1 hypothetical protein TRIADDRAFT_32597 [Trichoplax adhaerens]|eukprot:XP_002117439.1 hypothetical protein TRIADDRAFT_32597 [Trichoplax adhaerens]